MIPKKDVAQYEMLNELLKPIETKKHAKAVISAFCAVHNVKASIFSLKCRNDIWQVFPAINQ